MINFITVTLLTFLILFSTFFTSTQVPASSLSMHFMAVYTCCYYYYYYYINDNEQVNVHCIFVEPQMRRKCAVCVSKLRTELSSCVVCVSLPTSGSLKVD